MNARYRVTKASQTGHCCFEYSVIDTARAGAGLILADLHIGDNDRGFYCMCECLEEKDARLICAALNIVDKASTKDGGVEIRIYPAMSNEIKHIEY